MPTIVPWLLEREYAQHRSLDPSLPETYRQWQDWQQHAVRQVARLNRTHIVRMVVHPSELEAWARRSQRKVNEAARLAVAQALWANGIGRIGYVTRQPRHTTPRKRPPRDT